MQSSNPRWEAGEEEEQQEAREGTRGDLRKSNPFTFISMKDLKDTGTPSGLAVLITLIGIFTLSPSLQRDKATGTHSQLSPEDNSIS